VGEGGQAGMWRGCYLNGEYVVPPTVPAGTQGGKREGEGRDRSTAGSSLRRAGRRNVAMC